MRLSVLALALLASLATLTFSSHVQAASADRYCLQGRRWGFPGNCQFATRRQCLAAASGTNASCGLNPRYASSRRH
ncbi:DUF3551 domain-containing protein [Bradyrhizobium sp. NAS80.1]|uniref:DUF3551 domain-containing protein n=1 Tax=Bradyrhizobium sp. NAS80.1 TaxID=1680159 RepID=UPI0009FF4044|nr:DUF3551 domain-containing protein [Bradyrhizobium sp. NAS80.1]